MSKKRNYFKSQNELIDKETAKIEAQGLEKVAIQVIAAVNGYRIKTKADWNEALKNVQNIIYDALTEIYIITKNILKETYDNIPDIPDIKNIIKLTYNDDNTTLDSRIKQHWQERGQYLEEHKNEELDKWKEDVKLISSHLINDYDKILHTENTTVKTKTKQLYKPIESGIWVITPGECGDCPGEEIEAPEGEQPDGPPFHPNCGCSMHWEPTDDPDDIKDLDLEIEE